MGQRIGIGALAIVVIVGAVLLDVSVAQRVSEARRMGGGLDGPLGDLLLRGSVLPCFLTLMILRGAVEMNRILRATGASPHSFFAYVMIVLLLIAPWFSSAGWLGTGAVELEGLYWQLVCLIVAVVGVGLLTVARRNPSRSLADTGATLAMILYLGFMGSFAMHIRCGRDLAENDGAWLLLITLLVTKASDIGAYLSGSLFGRHKLIPEVSGGKTIEGSIGGMIASAGLAVGIVLLHDYLTAPASGIAGMQAAGGWMADAGALSNVAPSAFDFLVRLRHVGEDATKLFGAVTHPPGLGHYVRAAIFGLVLAIVGQLGDLFESCFKRDAGTKDSASLIPRYGGILDLIDSPLLAIPVAWFLFSAVWGLI